MARKAGLTHEEIVDAAVAQANEHGFYDLTLSAIAARLGVQSPSLYHHIDGLDAVRREIVRRAIETLNRAITTASDGHRGAFAFHAHADAHRQMAHEHPGLYTAVNATGYIADDRDMWEALITAIEPLTETMRELGFHDDATWEAIRLFRATIHGFLILELRGDFAFDLDPDVSFRRLVDVVLTGLQHELG